MGSEKLLPSQAAEAEKEFAEIFASYAKDLLIDIEYLRGKKVLDIGSGDGVFALALRKHGIDVTSLDGRRLEVPAEYKIPYTQAVAELLPFKAAMFDLTISRTAFPMVAHAKNLPGGSYRDWKNLDKYQQAVEAGFNEMIRVTKSGGEIRVSPIYSSASKKEGLFVKQGQVVEEVLAELKQRPDLTITTEVVRDDEAWCVIIRHRQS